jgi:predicted nuclease of predicted toxin-antitoxin system
MRFLFDENLSPKLVLLLADQFPNSVHVRDVGLASADDELCGTMPVAKA